MTAVSDNLVPRPRTLEELADHIEMDHERELPGMWAVRELQMLHGSMHRRRTWGHTHPR